MATPTSTADADTARHRGGAERLAEQLGGTDRLRLLLARIADAIDHGGVVRLDIVGVGGRVRQAPKLYVQRELW